MLTLLRPLNCAAADEIEVELIQMMAAYEVITKEISNEPYLIQNGEVIAGKSIGPFLEQYRPELISKRLKASDSREIG